MVALFKYQGISAFDGHGCMDGDYNREIGQRFGKTATCQIVFDYVSLEEDSRFGEPGCSRSVDTAYKQEGPCVLKAALLTKGAGAVELAGMNTSHLGLFMEILKYR